MPKPNRLAPPKPWVPALMTGLLWLQPVAAQSLQPLPWSAQETASRLSDLTQSSDVIWLETTSSGEFIQALVFSQLPLSAEAAYDLVRQPENYKRMSPSVDSVEVLERNAQGIRYSTKVNIPFGSIQNDIQMKVTPPDRHRDLFCRRGSQDGGFLLELRAFRCQSFKCHLHS